MPELTRQQWRNYHRRKGSWLDWAAVNDYLALQPPSPFAFNFDRWCDLFMRYYNRCFSVNLNIQIGEDYHYHTVTIDDLRRIWQRTNDLPGHAARCYYRAAARAEKIDAHEYFQEERAWRNLAATGDPDVSPEEYYKYD